MQNQLKKNAGLILAFIMFCGSCGAAFGEETVLMSETTPAVTISLVGDQYATSEQVVSVAVTAEAVNDVKADIFGGNTSWTDGGYGFYDGETGTFNETMLEMLRNSGVTHVRIPGGIEGDYFHWNESIGDLSARIAQIDPFSRNFPNYTDKDGESFVAYFGPDEWFELCNLTGTELTIQLNAGNGTPQEAADFVRYILESGVAIESIAVGNEVNMQEERVEGMTVTKTPEEYIAFYNEVWALLGDDVKQELEERGIGFGCIGVPPSHALCKYRTWDSDVLTALNGKADFIDIHIAYSPYYNNGESGEEIVKCLLASSTWVRKLLDQEIKLIDQNSPDTTIKMSEYGAIGAGTYSQSMPGAMYLATFFQTVLAEPKVTSADYLPLTNNPASNTLVSMYENTVTGEITYWTNVSAYVYRMYADQIGRRVLSAEVTGAKVFSAKSIGLMPTFRNVPEADAAVYYDETSKCGSIFLLNKSYDENSVFNLALPFDSLDITGVTELWCEDYGLRNGPSSFGPGVTPTNVVPGAYDELCCSVEGGSFTAVTKPVSLVKLDFQID